jgi:hypothetical protein
VLHSFTDFQPILSPRQRGSSLKPRSHSHDDLHYGAATLVAERSLPSAQLTNSALDSATCGCIVWCFWDTGLNPAQQWRQFEAASGEIGLA